MSKFKLTTRENAPIPAPDAAPKAASEPGESAARMTAVNYQHSANWPQLLERANASLLVSTYQAGKLVNIGREPDGRTTAFSFHAFDQVMGLAVSKERIAVGTRRQIILLRRAKDLAARIEPAGRYDDCFLTRLFQHTGKVHVHEMAWGSDELWFVNTLFSCLCTLDADSSFVPRWKPPFISTLAGEDRCHLNGLAMVAGRPAFMTAMSQTDTAAGWRPNKNQTGVILHVPSSEIITRGLCMPHSPRIHERTGQLWVLDSGRGHVSIVDKNTGQVDPVAKLPGYTRGFAVAADQNIAFIGLSKIRETAVFGGVPIAHDRANLKCGIAAVDLISGNLLGMLEFQSGVEEIFDVQLLPQIRFSAVSGPDPETDQTPTLWLAATPRWSV